MGVEKKSITSSCLQHKRPLLRRKSPNQRSSKRRENKPRRTSPRLPREVRALELTRFGLQSPSRDHTLLDWPRSQSMLESLSQLLTTWIPIKFSNIHQLSKIQRLPRLLKITTLLLLLLI